MFSVTGLFMVGFLPRRRGTSTTIIKACIRSFFFSKHFVFTSTRFLGFARWNVLKGNVLTPDVSHSARLFKVTSSTGVGDDKLLLCAHHNAGVIKWRPVRCGVLVLGSTYKKLCLFLTWVQVPFKYLRTVSRLVKIKDRATRASVFSPRPPFALSFF